jgi:hypothetical protein
MRRSDLDVTDGWDRTDDVKAKLLLLLTEGRDEDGEGNGYFSEELW